MHYRNGREAKNGDVIVQIGGFPTGGKITAVGVLHGATPGNDYCNGNIAPIQNTVIGACMVDCLHVDDPRPSSPRRASTSDRKAK